MNRDKAALLAALLTGVLAFLVFLPALGGDFVNWDDQRYVYENPFIRSIDLDFIKLIFTSILVSNYHPLTILSFAVDYSLWGLNPFGYHLVNNIFHALNTFFVTLLAIRLVRVKAAEGGMALFAGLAAGLLFGLHPVHVESVAWVSGRKDVLFTFFFLLSVLAYLRYAETSSRKVAYAASLLFFFFSILAKPMAVSLPIVLLILDYYPLERLKDLKKTLLEKVPFFAVSALIAGVTVWAQNRSGSLKSFDMIPLGARLLSAFRGYVFYIYKTVFPYELAPYYPHPLDTSLFNYEYIGSIVIFAVVSVFAVAVAKRYRVLSAVWLYYVITLLPVIGLVQVGRQAAADRYMYLPGIGLFVLAGAAAGCLFTRHWAALKAAVAIVSILFAVKTVQQARVWKDSISLWTHEIKAYPIMVPMAYNSRGHGYHAVGDFRRAIEDYTEAIRLNPFDSFPYNNRGLAYEELGDFTGAIEDYTKAIELDSGYVTAYINRGIAYGSLGKYAEAADEFTRSISLKPDNPGAYLNRGISYLRLGRVEDAIKDFSQALVLSPENPIAYYNLGLAHMKAGDNAKASEYFRKASSLGLKEAEEYI